MRRAVLVVVLGLIAAAIAGTPAHAHAILVKADPPLNAEVRDPPSQITLYFSEALERRFSSARVMNAFGGHVETGVSFDDQDDTIMRVALQHLDPGFYTVYWTTVSKVDGHGVSGSYPLTVLQPDGSQPPGARPATSTTTVSGTGAKPGRVVTKWLLLMGGCVLVGSLFFSLWVLPALPGEGGEFAREEMFDRAMVTAIAAIFVLVGAGVGDLLLQASTAGGTGQIGTVIQHTQWGQRWLLRNALLVPLAFAIFGALTTEARSWLWQFCLAIAIGLAGFYLVTVSSVSHAAAGAGSFWSTASDFVHLFAASVWIGMLLQVGLLLLWSRDELTREERPGVLAAALQRFSVVAVISIALLLVTGVFNAVADVDRVSDLTATSYGRTLLVKLLLIVPLLGVAGANAYIFRPRLEEEAAAVGEDPEDEPEDEDEGPEEWRALESSLKRALGIEAGLALLVLLVVAVLVQVAPARPTSSQPCQTPGKCIISGDAADVSLTLTIDPNQPGDNTFEVYLTGNAPSVDQVLLRFESQQAKGSEAILTMDASTPPVYWVGKGPFLPTAGDWKVTVELRRNTATDLLLPFAVKVLQPGTLTTSGSGDAFAFPRENPSASSIGLLVAAVCVALGIVIGSAPRPGLPSGYIGSAAEVLASPRLRPAVSLAMLAFIGVGLGVFFGTHAHARYSPDLAAKANPVPSSPASIAHGQDLFMANCAICHGADGKGDGPAASSVKIPPANLYQHVPFHPDQFFYQIISNGLSGVMPAFGNSLSPNDRWDILNYLRATFSQPPPNQ